MIHHFSSRFTASLALVVILCLALTGCTPANVLTTLDASVAATDALVVTLAATGTMDPAIAAEVVAVITPLPGISQQIVAEFSSADTDIVRAGKIAGWLAPVLKNITQLPPAAQAICAATLAAWQAFLAAYPVPAGVSASTKTTKFSASALNKIEVHVVKLTVDATRMKR
jgi:hypothetical protein